MHKLIVFATLLAVAAAAPGLAPLVSSWGHGALVGAPAVVSAPLVSATIIKQDVPVATSYANVNAVRISSPALVAAHAPALVAAHAPVIAAHGPVLGASLGHGLAHGW